MTVELTFALVTGAFFVLASLGAVGLGLVAFDIWRSKPITHPKLIGGVMFLISTMMLSDAVKFAAILFKIATQ